MLAAGVLAVACGPAEAPDAAPAPPVAAQALRPGPLRVVAVRPAPGTPLVPRTTFRVQFDRPVDPASAASNNINCYYPDPGAELVGDPFRFTATWLDGDGDAVLVQPPVLLVGREVRLVIGPGLRGADGTTLEGGAGLVVPYRVLELPEP